MLRIQPFAETEINHKKAKDPHFNGICINVILCREVLYPGIFRYKTQVEEQRKKKRYGQNTAVLDSQVLATAV